MTDAYSGRDSRRTNAPAGFFRRELVRATKANELKLSGSPIQYFTDPDYRNAAHRVLAVVEDEDFEGVDGTAVDVYQPFGRAVLSYVHPGASVIEIDNAQKYEGGTSLRLKNDAGNIPMVDINIDLPSDYQRLEFWVRGATNDCYCESDLRDGSNYLTPLRWGNPTGKFYLMYGNGAGGSNAVQPSIFVANTWFKIWIDVKPSADKWRGWIDEVMYPGPNADTEGWDNYYQDLPGPAPDHIRFWCRGNGKEGWVDMAFNLDSATYKLGVAGLYNHTDAIWLDPNVVVSSVSTDGYTITLSSGVAVGDLIEVYYYSTGVGWRDAETPSQVGDPLPPEGWDALVQKLNDCPSLDWENNSPTMDYDISMCNYIVPAPNGMENATTTVAKYTAAQIGTWQTSNTPFYVTAIHMGFSGASIVMDPTSGTTTWAILYTIDGGTERVISPNQIQHLTTPANTGVAGYYQSFFINLGLVECRSDFVLKVMLNPGTIPTAWETNVAGWHS